MAPRTSPNLLRRDTAAAFLIAAVLAGGCQSDTHKVEPGVQMPMRVRGASAVEPRDAPPSNASNLDPCAMRLHDLLGALFLYYFNYQRLPATLGEVNTAAGADEPVPLTCPTSNQPYVYTPDGITMPEQHARIIVYDPTPAHYGGKYRWAIRMEDPADGKPLVARVVALPEKFFTFVSPPAKP